jgi:hypothetical protein
MKSKCSDNSISTPAILDFLKQLTSTIEQLQNLHFKFTEGLLYEYDDLK